MFEGMLVEEMTYEGAHFAHICARNEHDRKNRIRIENARVARNFDQKRVSSAFDYLRKVFA